MLFLVTQVFDGYSEGLIEMVCLRVPMDLSNTTESHDNSLLIIII